MSKAAPDAPGFWRRVLAESTVEDRPSHPTDWAGHRDPPRADSAPRVCPRHACARCGARPAERPNRVRPAKPVNNAGVGSAAPPRTNRRTRNTNRTAAGLHTRRRQRGTTMNKTELIERIAQEAGVPESEAQEHFGAFERVVTEALKGGEEVRIMGFGKFSVKERKAREGRNPQTGEKMQIKAQKVPAFSAGNALKQAV